MKTEKQKMLDGELYLASDPVLCHDRLKARNITNEFNHSNEIDDNKRTKLIKELFGSTGKRSTSNRCFAVITVLIYMSGKISSPILTVFSSMYAKSG